MNQKQFWRHVCCLHNVGNVDVCYLNIRFTRKQELGTALSTSKINRLRVDFTKERFDDPSPQNIIDTLSQSEAVCASLQKLMFHWWKFDEKQYVKDYLHSSRLKN